jgi:hypothetical protein
MANDTKTSDVALPPGLSPVPSEPPETTPTAPSSSQIPSPVIPPTPPVVPPIPSTKTPPPVQEPVQKPVIDPSALADLAKSLGENPLVVPAETKPVQSDSTEEKKEDTVGDVSTEATGEPKEKSAEDTGDKAQIPEEKGSSPKKSGGRTSAIIGGIFLLIVLPVVGYYVTQTTDITRVLQFASQPPPEDYCDTHPNARQCKEGTLPCCPKNPKPWEECVVCKTPTQKPTKTPTSTPTLTPTISPTITLTNTPTISPTITLTNTPTNTQTVTPTATVPPFTPGICDSSCGVDSDCRSGMICATVQGIKRCRNPECTAEWTCVCPAKTATPIVYQQVQQVVVTATPRPVVVQTPKTPVSGVPSILGAATVVGGALLLLIGFIL